MNLKEIQQLIEIVNVSALDEVIIKDGQSEITLRRNNSKAQAVLPTAPVVAQPIPAPLPAVRQAVQEQPAPAAAEPAVSDLIEIYSPIVGTFYRSPSPDSLPFVNEGDKVKPGDVLCIIEAMKLMNEIESEVSGTIVEILVENGQPVEYNQALFRVKP
ncbi:MAG TPA: acetyl-CoA carboxylase biotin carboxyl carrier protein [Chlorobaculum sp.]|jgi:acetyl-CoA carboxylase biotin carboxyl carrier protein|uniref:Biotin carboxyl carrier protein of acetyl-CoA carboxylase n=1 Tax=Chlorobaculum tepidum (strain ATCC 49652 / DSM 12025 / NBRC 103806 / TLS) TaxID=194439 RepID=Q8KG12_CHLTE|nr:acetyl-CoA carboxylase biotin carboxyl carrier protein [Chlorobaculum tepidum]AAM71406.1 acetyl-CoA carboxylase, biotin carboxyl carrier protein [Chlorobaculum tepidum TLS]HBU23633.1 acetyl-CoA carboxylase biotin carboxyl carrier protein [Chlorobaculum sp.]